MQERFERQIGMYCIDLGSSNSVISCYRDGQVQVVTINGQNSQSSVVCYYEKDQVACGSQAYAYLADPQYNAYCVYLNKRIKGKKYCDVENLVRNIPHEVTSNGYTVYTFRYGDEVVQKTPLEVDVDYLKWLIKSAEDVTTIPCRNLVVTYPALFEPEQIDITKRALKQIHQWRDSIHPLCLLQEPISASIANLRPVADRRNFIVYDFGGGTFDIAILECQFTEFTVKHSSGKAHLGGMDIDRQLVMYIQDKLPRVLIMEEVNYLRYQCERAKIELSTRRVVDIPVVFNGINQTFRITREMFEDIIKEIIEETIRITNEAIAERNIQLGGNDVIILVGGSSRIPLVKRMLAEQFHININNDINPIDIVSKGGVHYGINKYCRENNLQIPMNVIALNVQLLVLRDVGISFDARIQNNGQNIQLVIPRLSMAEEQYVVQLPRNLFGVKIYVYTRDNSQSAWKYRGFIRANAFANVQQLFLYMDCEGKLKYYYPLRNAGVRGEIEFDDPYPQELNEEIQRRYSTSKECIDALRNMRRYYINCPLVNEYDKIIENAINTFFNTNTIVDYSCDQQRQYASQIWTCIRDSIQQQRR